VVSNCQDHACKYSRGPFEVTVSKHRIGYIRCGTSEDGSIEYDLLLVGIVTGGHPANTIVRLTSIR